MWMMVEKFAGVMLALAVMVAPVVTCCSRPGDDAKHDQHAASLAVVSTPAEHACCALSQATAPGPISPSRPKHDERPHHHCGCDHTQIIDQSDASPLATNTTPSWLLPALVFLPAYQPTPAHSPARWRIPINGNRDDGPYHGDSLRAQACLLTV